MRTTGSSRSQVKVRVLCTVGLTALIAVMALTPMTIASARERLLPWINALGRDSGSPPWANEDSRVVVLYGDSLAYSARDYFSFTTSSRGWAPVVRTFGGTAPCDWMPQLETDLALRPAYVVFAFSGNSMTPCMVDPATGAQLAGPAVVDKYRADVTAMVALASAGGARPVVVGTPVAASGGGAALAVMDQQIVDATPGALYVDGGETIAPGGVYVPAMPCRSDEGAELGCVDGMIRVRNDDGVHFCPDDPVSMEGRGVECPVYASGARRYGELLASPTS